MPVKKDPDGRRSVAVETEVPGSPEEVWNAIATGPGISSWFVPTEVEEREGGSTRSRFGLPGMEAVATLRDWDPPRRFVAESPASPGEPAIATEWTVEARAGGTCTVRVVHSWFASDDDWDGQFEQHEAGWAEFFRLLRLYLTHFRGQRGALLQLLPSAPAPKEAAWAALLTKLGVAKPVQGATLQTSGDAPPLRGELLHVGPESHPELLVARIEAPAPGLVHLFALPLGDRVYLTLRFYLYGDGASDAVTRLEPIWRAWLARHFTLDAG